MPLHVFFFFAASGFVAGAAAGGFGLAPLGAALVAVLAAPVFFIVKNSVAALADAETQDPRYSELNAAAVLAAAIFFFIGNFYYAADDRAYHVLRRALDGATQFEGIVSDEPRRREAGQSARVRLISSDVEQSVGAMVLVQLHPYPELSYGDVVRGDGAITPSPRNSYGDYLAKERIHGTALYPTLEIVGNEVNPFFGTLYEVRRRIKDSIGRLFTRQQAVFLSGILLGGQEEFSKEFLEKLSLSGTLHLTALSGQNMTIIVFAAFAVFSAVFGGRKRPVFAVTFLLVALFVAMTGFALSAIRASLMAFLVGLARQAGRSYSPRNAIALAALAITAWNPKAPALDLGFQLSFAAMLSIIYFAPVLTQLPFLKKEGLLGWREVLAITLAAQLGVLPITMLAFENFSFSALPANIALLTVMPVVMGLGFATVFASAVWTPLAVLLSKPTAFLLDYAAGVISVFYEARLPFNPALGGVAVTLYYAVLIWICIRYAVADKR